MSCVRTDDRSLGDCLCVVYVCVLEFLVLRLTLCGYINVITRMKPPGTDVRQPYRCVFLSVKDLSFEGKDLFFKENPLFAVTTKDVFRSVTSDRELDVPSVSYVKITTFT